MAVSKVGGVTEIQVFRPTMEEFSDFSAYVEFMESNGAHLGGIAKIVPPPEWKPRQARNYDTDDVMKFVIDSPVDQTIIGQQGVYTLFNVTNRKSMKVEKFKELAQSKRYAAPIDGIEELERKYWRNITLNPPIYGADTPGSFYDENVDEWNITRLRTILSDVMSQQKIEGVNTAYLYFGMWRSTFSWHTEDMDLYSINYLHHGEPKFWYSIPTEHANRFERLAGSYFAESARECSAYLRHKMCIISPNVLRNNSIPINKMVQNQGEFIITFPKGYHAGFNLGYNIAESTNFALLRWINYGKKATLCMCKADSVRINMDTFVYKFQYDQYEEWKKSRQKQQQKFVLKQGLLDDFLTSQEMSKWKPRISKQSQQTQKRLKSITTATPNPDDAVNTTILGHSRKLKKVKKNVPSCSSSDEEELGVGNSSVVVVKSKSALVDDEPWACSLLTDPYRLGRWAEALERLWQFKMFNIQAEMEFNRDRSLLEPHCCICQYFVPKVLARKVDTFNQIPACSRRILPDNCFHDRGQSPAARFKNVCSSTTTTDTFSGESSSTLSVTCLSTCSDGILEKVEEGCNGNQPSASSSSHLPCRSTDELLTCSRCFVTVHKKCYGVPNKTLRDKDGWDEFRRDGWECERCRLACSTAECQLCCLRGGALRPTDDLNWVHVICALFAPKRRFNYNTAGAQNGESRITLDFESKDAENPASSTDDTGKMSRVIVASTPIRRKCVFCRSDAGHAVPCDFAQGVCENAMHPTCGYEAGCSFELRRGAFRPLNIMCCNHNCSLPASGGGKSTAAAAAIDVRPPTSFGDDAVAWTAPDAASYCRPKFGVGVMVWAKRGNDSYYKGCVCNHQIETFCIVDFDDGTFSNNVYLDDIRECDCIDGDCRGAHYSGARVKVHWVADGQLYGAVFRRAYQTVTYNVRLENGDFDRCTGDELSLDPPDEFLIQARRKKSKTKAEKKFSTTR